MTPPDGLGSIEPARSENTMGQEPAWDAGPTPGAVTRWLTKLSGVDYHLARKQPCNEQRTMALVGAALLLGSAFQAVCIFVAFHVMVGDNLWQLAISALVTILATSILFVYDSKFVSHDWVAQGLSFCQLRDIVVQETATGRWLRPLVVGVRWGVSLAVASFVAWFVLAQVFNDDIQRELARENRVANAPVVAALQGRYETLVGDVRERIRHHDTRMVELAQERVDLRTRGAAEPVVERQISVLMEEVDRLLAARAQAERAAREHQTAANAEEYGVKVNRSSTGVAGPGPRWAFHNREAKEYQAKTAAITTELEPKSRALEDARKDAAVRADASNSGTQARLATIEQRLTDFQYDRSALASELKTLEDGREDWILRHVITTPDFVSVATGLSDRLRALWNLVQSSELIASVALGLKLFIMALESAGPISKTLFGSAGLYSMRVAVRIEDAADEEAERRDAWGHDRFLRRSRREEEREGILKARRHRDMARRGFEALNASIEKATSLRKRTRDDDGGEARNR